MTADETTAILRLLAAAYPTQRQRMSRDDARAIAAMYIVGLADLDDDRVRAAVNRLVSRRSGCR